MKRNLRTLFYKMIYLISCVLNNQTPEPVVKDNDEADRIYELAKRHTLNAIVATGFERAGIVHKTASEEKNMAIRKIMLLDAERREILADLEKNGIKYMPLKGVIMKELYPSIGLRQMADNDILFDYQYRERVRDIMVARGFKVQVYNHSNQDVYMKKPVYNYEMHTMLFNPGDNTVFDEYFTNPFDTADKMPGTSYGYAMRDEDYYVYIKSHEYKHYSGGGTGLRSLLDAFVLLRAKGDKLDWGYIEAELDKLGILEYDRKTRNLASKIFSSPKTDGKFSAECLSKDEHFLLGDFVLHGTYGTFARRVENNITKLEKQEGKKVSRFSYLMRHLFPPVDYYEKRFPLAYKYRILIPFVIIKRLFGMIFLRPVNSYKRAKDILHKRKK